MGQKISSPFNYKEQGGRPIIDQKIQLTNVIFATVNGS